MSSRPAPPRPKRGGEEFARTHYLQDEGPASKKPKFDVRNPSALAPDAPEEDAVLEADEIGRRGQQTKRNAVNIDGYGSDSSNEGFDGRAEVKAREAKKRKNPGTASRREEESDMFADLDEEFKDGDEDEDLAGESKKQKKNVRFLDVEEIDGQVAGSKSGGHVSADFSLNGQGSSGRHQQADAESSSSSESDVDEAERAGLNGKVDVEVGAGGKKEHAPLLDAFNMKSEQEEGRFDAHGNFVRKAADPDAVHDSWLEGVSKRDMKKAKEAAIKRDEERRRKILADDAVLTSDVLRTLIPCLERGETVLEALARLGPGKDKKKKPKWQHAKAKNKALSSSSSTENNNHNDMDAVTETSPEDAIEKRRRETVEAITGAADQLLTRGQATIYDVEREVLMRQYRRETGEDWVDEAPRLEAREDEVEGGPEVKQWEYRWPDGRDGGEAHGPYDGEMMAGWTDAGYFGDGVEFRRVGEGGEWSRSARFD